jgi:hypothetical protein
MGYIPLEACKVKSSSNPFNRKNEVTAGNDARNNK